MTEMDEHAWQEVAALGLAPDKPRRLLLLPLAYVAAASRRHDLALLDGLIESSAQVAHIDPEGAALAHAWLRRAPTPGQFRRGLALLRGACGGEGSSLTAQDLIESVLWACSAAQLDRARNGRRYTAVSAEARGAIAELETALGVDVGELWSDVMELGGEPLLSKTVDVLRRDGAPDSNELRQG